MPEFNIILPSKPIIVSENEKMGVYEVEGLYPGYGHTLGNSLRRIILSSLPGFAITAVKIDGVAHEFSTIDGVKEDVITIILNLKKVRFKVVGDEAVTLNLKVTGGKEVTAGDITTPGNVEIVNADHYICNVTEKGKVLDMEITIEKGLGYVPKETLQKDKVDIGVIALDAIFTPVRRVSYEVEPMRVGNRTDYNRLRITIETNGDITPKAALEESIAIMIHQLKAIVGFKEDIDTVEMPHESDLEAVSGMSGDDKHEDDVLKTRIEDLELSARTMKALSGASIRTVGGLSRKKEEDLLEIAGMGEKGVQEIKRALSNFGIVLK